MSGRMLIKKKRKNKALDNNGENNKQQLMPKNWKKYIISDFIDINPKVPLTKGEEYSFVEMKDLNPNNKYVSPSVSKELKGGARFQNGDTLFARITPCLENGKICQVKDLENNLGFGSTEFLVFRGKQTISDSDFIFYLSRTPFFRRFSEAKMIGTSGRQRVAKDAFENLELLLPPPKEQKSIASILSALDDKIELNLQMNKTLEEMAMALYKHWFVDFGPFQDGEFVGSELGEIPKGWEVLPLADFAFKKSESFNFRDKNEVVFINTGDVLEGRFLHKNISPREGLPGQAKKAIAKGDILYSEIRPKNKRFAYVNFDSANYVVSTKFMIINPKENILSKLLYRILSLQSTVDNFNSIAEGRSGTFPQITFDAISNEKFILAPMDLQKKFQNLVGPMELQQDELYKENQVLKKLRDTLLPKLISGEVRVKEAEKTLSEVL